MDLLTIGHSNHNLESFIHLLHKHGVTAIGDVRSSPYSRYAPHFNQFALQKSLEAEDIQYVFLGEELGARTTNSGCYVNGKALYEKIAATDTFNTGIQRIVKGVEKYKIALMCAEKDPLTCHRAVLICPHLRKFNLNINHILKEGDLESHFQLEDRMLAKQGFNNFCEQAEPLQLSLFDLPSSNNLLTKEDCLKKAYQLQGSEIAYIDKQGKYHEQAS